MILSQLMMLFLFLAPPAMSADPALGSAIPEMSLPSVEGGMVKLPDALKGKWTLIYFYPKDDTPGCTKQACSYRDGMSEFKKLGVQLLGVSLDDLKSHEKFKSKYKLNFPLLSDVEMKLSKHLGSYGKQTILGVPYQGLSRDTFLIGPDAVVREVWRKVDPSTTVRETLEGVKRHQAKQ